MITLLTGQPGNGKTSWIINRIKEELAKGKIVYTCGIPALDLPVIPLTKRQLMAWSETEPVLNHKGEVIEFLDLDFDDPLQVPKLLNIQEGAVLFVDEAQKQGFEPTGTSVPKHVRDLDEHRHFGLDFVFITQFPDLVHKIVRALVTHHFHIRFTWSGRRIHEWSEWQNDPKSKTSLENSTSKRYTIDKSTFKHYHSASLHVKHKHTVPMRLYFIIAALLLLPYMIYKSIDRVRAHSKPPEIQAEEKSPSLLEVPKLQTGSVSQNEKKPEIKKALYNVYSLPDVFDWDSINACVASSKKCTCYDYNAVTLIVPEHICRIASKEGWKQSIKLQVSTQPKKSL